MKSDAVNKAIELPGRGRVVLIEGEIFLLDRRGQQIWQAEAAVASHGAVGYSNIHLSEDKKLLAYSANGIEYSIDPASGKVTSKDLTR